MLAVGLDDSGAVRRQHRCDSSEDPAAFVAALIDAALTVGGPAPTAVGLGLPGQVDAAGALRFSPHLPGLVGADIRGALTEAFRGATTWVGNDATAAAWAEHEVGAAQGASDSLTVTLGTGIGGGIVCGGRLVTGARGYAGEFGHVVIDPHGQRCPCGKQGCWERYASGSGLGLLGREAAVAGQLGAVVAEVGDAEAVRGEHVTAAAAAGDAEALAVVDRFAWWLALGLANLANAFDPEVIVLGGGVVVASGVLLEPTRRAFAVLAESPGARIEAAALGERAGAVGAALLA